jgi:hypothetical protein
MKELKIASIVYLHIQSISFQHNNAAAAVFHALKVLKVSERDTMSHQVIVYAQILQMKMETTCDLYHALKLKWEVFH